MGDTRLKLEKDLRIRVTRFLASKASHFPNRQRAIFSLTERIRKQNWEAVLFGGTLRDLMIYGGSRSPRDVDIVIAGVVADQIESLFADCVVRRTRFGGLHLQYNGWMFDVWSLNDTWALRNSGQSRWGFQDLPKTTFLNVEAVAADLIPRPGKARHIHANGFFEAVSNRVLDINYEENPFPILCVVRTLITAARLQYSISPRLCRYLLHYGRSSSPEEMVDVQIKHYGMCKRTAEEFHSWLRFVGAEHRGAGTKGLTLPVAKSRQLELFEEWTPAW
jgi:hypothetical protein